MLYKAAKSNSFSVHISYLHVQELTPTLFLPAGLNIIPVCVIIFNLQF